MKTTEFIYTVLLKPKTVRKFANGLLRSILPRTRSVRGATIHLNPNDPVISGALTLGVYENEEMDFFCKWFQPGMTLLDVGANVGLYTGLALTLSPQNIQILCIEPSGENRKFLMQTIASNQKGQPGGRVTVVPLAAAKRSGKQTLFKNPQNKGDNRIYADPLLSEEEEIETDRLDSICKREGVQSADFIKVDVQGAEFHVLSGAGNLIQDSPDCILMTEFWPYGIQQCGASAREYLELLRGYDFSLWELSGKGLTPVRDFEQMIGSAPGRTYKNLVGFKGKYATQIQQQFRPS